MGTRVYWAVTNNAVVDPIEAGTIPTPSLDSGEEWHYIYKGWDKALSTNMTANATYTAQYKTDRYFTVTFVDYDGTVLDTQNILDEEDAVDPVSSGRIATPLRASTAQYDYTYSGWDKSLSNIKADTTVTATYSNVTRKYTVRFWDGQNLLGTVVANYGTAPSYSGVLQKTDVDDPENYLFLNWSPSLNGGVKADTDCYAMWEQMTISDSWAQIFAAEDDGSYRSKYKIGDTKSFVLGTSEIVVMQIVAMDADTLADGSGNAKISWVSKYLLKTQRKINNSGTKDGWAASLMRTQLRDNVYPGIPDTIRDNIKEVSKTYYDKTTNSTLRIDDTVWIPSQREVFGSGGENTGCVYTDFFNSASIRAKKIMDGGATHWWLRSAYSGSATFFGAIFSGSYAYTQPYNPRGVALGFCT